MGYNFAMHSYESDPLWGEISLDEPVLAELAHSAPMQRLKGVHQAGASFYLLPEQRRNTRYEHSLGVMHLLALLGASLEEQAAGLLHDVPHTAFSHTIDIVFPSDEHNFHEGFQRQVILASDIPDILSRHDIPLQAALEPDSYPLLEQPLPSLCADRVDYSLRDMKTAGKITSKDAYIFLSHLVATARGIIVSDVDTARWYVALFEEANALLWTGPDEAGAYWALAGAIKRAYEMGAFTDLDLFATDDEAMQKLRGLDDPGVNAYLHLLQPGTHFYEVEGPGPFFTTRMKNRAVDPFVLSPGSAQPLRLSEVPGGHAGQLHSDPQPRNVAYKLWSDSISPSLEAQL